MRYAALIAIAAVLALPGCSARVASPEEAAKMACEPSPTDYQEKIQAYMGTILKDPMSAQYQFYVPQKAHYKGNCGWMIRVDVNAKNSYGGYTGAKIYQFIIYQGQLEQVNTMLTTFLND